MKSLVHSYLWWPDGDADIEQKVKHCNQCQINQRKLPVMLLYPWEWLGKPWNWIHFDYAGPFQLIKVKCFWLFWTVILWNGLMYMLQVQLPQLSPLTNFRIHSQSLSYLKWLFLIMGLFQQPGVPNLCEQNGIQHVRTAAYHPSSNGLTEHYVQIINDDLKKITASSLELWLARLLLRYTVTPQSMTEVSPVELKKTENYTESTSIWSGEPSKTATS